MPIISHIDGVNRDIYLHADTVGASVHPIDIYKEMRALRRTDESLRGFDVFLSARGNDFKGGGKYTERYVICNLGTRIIPFDVSQELTITGTIITDDGQEGVSCFDRTGLTATTVVDINYVPPQVEVVRAEAELLALVKASYGNTVVIDVVNGYAGTGVTPDGDYIGTYAAPSSNVTDAKTIAESLGLSVLKFIGNYNLTENIDGWDVDGQSIGRTTITAQAGCSTSDVSIRNCTVTGVLDGAVSFTDAYLRDISGVGCTTNAMTWKHCQIEGEIVLRADNNVDLHILDCWSGVSGHATPIVNANNTTTEIDVRGYIGGFELTNYNQAGNVSIDLEGHIVLQSTVSNGTFVVRGRGKKTIAPSGTAEIDSENFLQTSTIQESIDRTNYIGKEGLGVTVNAITGVDLGVSPYGTRASPCKTEQNIQDISELYGLKNVYFQDDFTVNEDHSTDPHNFFGDNANTITVTCGPLSNVSNCTFRDAHVTGKLGANVVIREGVVGDVTEANSFIYTCALHGTIQVSDSLSIEECWVSPLAVNQEVTIDFNGLAKIVILSDWSAGKVRPINMVPGSFIGMAGTGGMLITDTSNTGGTVVIGGMILIDKTYLDNMDSFTDASVSGLIEAVDASVSNRREKDTTAKTITVYEKDNVTPRDVFTYIDDGEGDILDIIPQ